MFKFDFSEIPPQKLNNLDFFPMLKFDFSEIPPQIEKLRFFSYVQIWLFRNTSPPHIWKT